jgi:hypothetical protein
MTRYMNSGKAAILAVQADYADCDEFGRGTLASLAQAIHFSSSFRRQLESSGFPVLTGFELPPG